MRKRMCSAVLAAFMTLSLVQVPAFAAGGAPEPETTAEEITAAQTERISEPETTAEETAAARTEETAEPEPAAEETAEVWAEKAGAEIQAVFPDENFRKYVQEEIDTDQDGFLSQEEIDRCTNINVSYKSIKSLAGIEIFSSLTDLYCAQNGLSSLDVSQNTALVTLNCSGNNLSSLDVSQNTALESLDCAQNDLSSVDVSKNQTLTRLNCRSCKLSSVDVSKNPALVTLDCSSNDLTTLDVSKNPELISLWCESNRLSSLDLEKNPKVGGRDNFLMYNNQITVSLSAANQFDLSTLPGFDVSRVASVTGGSISGNILTVDAGAETVSYEYDTRAPKVGKRTFTLCIDRSASKPDDTPGTTDPATGISYQAHVQSIGWQDPVSNGKLAGTIGKAKRLEGIRISIAGIEDLGVQYTAHVQSYGWLPWVSDGAFSGTEGEAKRLEAVKIQLTGADKDKYDIYYRVHAQSYGWLGWAKNGEAAGTAGQAKRLEAIHILVVAKGTPINEEAEGIKSVRKEAYIAKAGTSSSVSGADAPTVSYQTHVQSYGWQSRRYNGQMSGTSGEAKRLEAIKINVSNLPCSGGITYRTHVQSQGWQDEKSNGELAGTSGKAKRLEAIQIRLTGELADRYDVYYRVHAQSYGWLVWAKNGESAGTEGLAKRLEAIQIVLVPKSGAAPAANYGGITSVNASAFIKK